jgi:TctA family transporter
LVSMYLRNLLDRKLVLRLTIPSIIAAVILVGVIIDTFSTTIPAITLAWILVGIIIGYPFGRLTKISWNSDRAQLVLVGSQVVILGVYLVTKIITSIIIRMEFGYLAYVLAIVSLTTVGSIVGKTLGTLRQIQMVRPVDKDVKGTVSFEWANVTAYRVGN